MSTSYYAYIKIKPSVKDELKKAIDEDNLIELESLHENVEMGIPVGHRAGGWKFSWSPYNKHIKTLDVKGIKEFVYRDDVVIYNEYREIMNKDEFLEMAFNWGKDDGWDSETYHKEHPDERRYPVSEYQHQVCRALNNRGLSVKFNDSYQCEFYSDGLRWSIFE